MRQTYVERRAIVQRLAYRYAAKLDITCKRCGETGTVTKLDGKPHYARADCQQCQKFIAWLPKPPKTWK